MGGAKELCSSRAKPAHLASRCQDRTTAGVSYVLASSSSQRGVSPAQAPLPPTVIRPPPAVVPLQSASAVATVADSIVNTALHQPVAALLMPQQDDLVKAYLLDGPGRHALAARGSGVEGLDDLLSDMQATPSFARDTAHLGSNGSSIALAGHPQLRLYTRSCRLEMYVAERTWQRLSAVQQAALAGAMHRLEQPGPFPWPTYFIGTRDSFTHRLVPLRSQVEEGARSFVRTDFFFQANDAPDNYAAVMAAPLEHSDELLPVGITTYTEVFSDAELAAMEAGACGVDQRAREGCLPPACFHTTHGRAGGLKRTKLFFGARYLWTHEQMSAPEARRANGVRADVPAPPAWMKELVEAPMVSAGIMPATFVDSFALNLYHDGSEGIQSHFDDAGRFDRPIWSLRLFSDSRLSFGTQLYGYTNGAFYVDMPRGCITVMQSGGYAAAGLKHCVRPVDMAGRSAGLIMRRIRQSVPCARQKQSGMAALERQCWRVLDKCIWRVEKRSDAEERSKRRAALLPAKRPPPGKRRCAANVPVTAMPACAAAIMGREGMPAR
ncbi:hypothetical protein WJX81_000973 [Elliptochloris bilobata]|uniref:Fe2OG dioxygenase domain-containing protein n=1 Tax=Elliptochloris bilobata TaxID=381761 RepID=A0AAW1RWW0_9CHLO